MNITIPTKEYKELLAVALTAETLFKYKDTEEYILEGMVKLAEDRLRQDVESCSAIKL